MSLTTRVVAGLLTGLGIGLAIAASRAPALVAAANVVAPIGTLWINAIRMTVIPLVVASLVAGLASVSNPSALGRLGLRAVVFFVGTLLAGAILAAVVAPPVFRALALDPAAIESLRATATGSPGGNATGISITQWLLDLVPNNPVRAAAEGAMLPLIVFSLAFGLGLATLSMEARAPVVRVFEAVRDAALTVVRWVLAAAPIGVFALALALATKLGLAAAGAIASYVALVSLLTVVFTLIVLYPLAASLGRMRLRDFARAALPAQAVAFSSRSSLASLPAMIETARTRLGLPEEIPAFFLPLAASVYRVGAGVGLLTGIAFIARLYGVELSVAQLATAIVTVVLTSFSVPGIPGGSIIIMTPALLAVGLPAEGVGILLGIDTIPDMFRTTSNITGNLAAAVSVGGGTRESSP